MTHTQTTISYGHWWLDDFTYPYTSDSSCIADAGTNATTLVDAYWALGAGSDDYFNGGYIRYKSGAAIGLARKITDFDGASGTFTNDTFGATVPAAGDTYELSLYAKVEDGQTLAAPTISEDDFFDIQATVSAGNKVGYYTNLQNIGANSTVYTKFRYRYKTSDTSVKAKIVLVFSDANTQEILAETANTTLTSGVATITTLKTVDHVRLYCNAATGHVYYDFAFIYKNDFTIPNSAAGMDWLLKPSYAHLKPFGMEGAHTQAGGSKLAEWHLSGDLTRGNWKRTDDKLSGEVFVEIAGKSASEPWQWFDSKLGACKVTMDEPVFRRDASGERLDWTFSAILREYRVSNAGCTHETYRTRFSIDQVT